MTTKVHFHNLTGCINRFKKLILNINIVYQWARDMIWFSYNLHIIWKDCRYLSFPSMILILKSPNIIWTLFCLLICSIECKKEAIWLFQDNKVLASMDIEQMKVFEAWYRMHQ